MSGTGCRVSVSSGEQSVVVGVSRGDAQYQFHALVPRPSTLELYLKPDTRNLKSVCLGPWVSITHCRNARPDRLFDPLFVIHFSSVFSLVRLQGCRVVLAQFDPEVAKDIDETDWPRVTLLKVQMNADLLTEDLKKKRASNESFWLIGQPDITVQKIKDGKDKGKYRVEVMGFDYYNTKTGTIESGGNEKIAMWMLDTDYDGRSLFAAPGFLPDGWRERRLVSIGKESKSRDRRRVDRSVSRHSVAAVRVRQAQACRSEDRR